MTVNCGDGFVEQSGDCIFDSNDGKTVASKYSLLQRFCNPHMRRQMDYIETGCVCGQKCSLTKSIQIMRRALGVKASSLLDKLLPRISVSKEATWHANSGNRR